MLAGLVSPVSADAQRDRLRSPNRLALMPGGKLLVSDHRMQGVLEWLPRRQKEVRWVRVPGRAAGLAFGWNRLFVGNARTASVDVYNRGGKLLYILGAGDGQVARPSDIAVAIDRGLVFVTDTNNGHVLVFDYRGALLYTIPSPGQTPMYQPTGIAVDPAREEVLVSDYGKAGLFSMKASVKIYTYDGLYVTQLSGNQPDGFGFSRPQGLAVNSQGLIYLVDSFRGQVLVFDRETLRGVETIGSLGRMHGQLYLPLDVAIDEKADVLYVSDNRNRRVEVFEGKGILP